MAVQMINLEAADQYCHCILEIIRAVSCAKEGIIASEAVPLLRVFYEQENLNAPRSHRPPS
ncbi:unnamed protein product [Coffea canephora]|uniref:Uncharacterized protein n=1 Tax=Coffea canephora TaxID=49390 RepID=A0A068UGX3_COFCA|nr:unnamed protein product [Coffea canephora]